MASSASPPKDEPAVTASRNTTSEVVEDVPEFSPEEQADLRKQSAEIKTEANALFASKEYQNAIARYTDALDVCPRYFYFERAVIQSNVSACHVQLEEWKEAIKAATSALDGLAEMEKQDLPQQVPVGEATTEDTRSDEQPDSKTDDDAEEEIVSAGASRSAPAADPAISDEEARRQARTADIRRIRTKALLRRGRARSQAGGWSNLSGAKEDYKTLAGLPADSLTPADLQTVRHQLRALPPRTKKAQEEEMAEMWGKMKNLGNKILNPFGLSTDNFQMTKDEKTGGYSMNFTQGGQ